MFTDRAFGGKEAEPRELVGFIVMHRQLALDWINLDTGHKYFRPLYYSLSRK